jgi:hypothetical protein
MSEPTPPTGPPDMEKLMALAAKYANEILGPLPDRQGLSTNPNMKEQLGHCNPGSCFMFSNFRELLF